MREEYGWQKICQWPKLLAMRCSLFIAALLLGCEKPTEPPAPNPKLSFATDIHGLFQKYCHECHGAEKTEAGLDLRTIEAMLKDGEGGPAIIPGNPNESLLIKLLESGEMPPDGARPSREEVARIRRWVEGGAAP